MGAAISRGSFCSVRVGFQKDFCEPVAIKVICKAKVQKCVNKKQLLFNELTLSRYLDHPNIVRVRDTVESSNTYFVVMDLFEQNLLEALEKREYTDAWKLRAADQILAAIEYLHIRDLCHRDIKLENVMMDKDGSVHLTDFGFAAFAFEKVSGVQGSLGYVAPEVTKNEPYDGKKADMWSFGCLLYRLFADELPFGETANSQGCSGEDLDYDGIPDGVSDLIRRLLSPEPSMRPNATEVRADRIFESLTDRSDSSIDVDPLIDDNVCHRVGEILQEDASYVKGMVRTESRENTMYVLLCETMKSMNFFMSSKGCIVPSCSYPPPKSRFSRILLEGGKSVSISQNFNVVSAELQKLLIKKKYCVSTSIMGVRTAIINTPENDVKVQFQLVDSFDGKCVVFAEGDEDHVGSVLGDLLAQASASL